MHLASHPSHLSFLEHFTYIQFFFFFFKTRDLSEVPQHPASSSSFSTRLSGIVEPVAV